VTIPPQPAPPDLAAIEARAAAAPGGYWVVLDRGVWIPWSAPDDAQSRSGWDTGRYLAVEDGDWHGSGEPPRALWEFIAAARQDVPALVAEVRRLRAELAALAPMETR